LLHDRAACAEAVEEFAYCFSSFSVGLDTELKPVIRGERAIGPAWCGTWRVL